MWVRAVVLVERGADAGVATRARRRGRGRGRGPASVEGERGSGRVYAVRGTGLATRCAGNDPGGRRRWRASRSRRPGTWRPPRVRVAFDVGSPGRRHDSLTEYGAARRARNLLFGIDGQKPAHNGGDPTRHPGLRHPSTVCPPRTPPFCAGRVRPGQADAPGGGVAGPVQERGAAASRARSERLTSTPHAKPPSDPSPRSTRWQGTNSAGALRAQIEATARTALGRLSAVANSV